MPDNRLLRDSLFCHAVVPAPPWVSTCLRRGLACHRASVAVAVSLNDRERRAIGLCNLGLGLSLGPSPDYDGAIAQLQQVCACIYWYDGVRLWRNDLILLIMRAFQSKRLAPTLVSSGRAVFGLGKVYAKQVQGSQVIWCGSNSFLSSGRLRLHVVTGQSCSSCQVLRGRR